MKKLKCSFLLFLMILAGCTGCGKKSALQEVRLNEVAHSIFYAPQYVAIEEGYLEEEGISLKLVNGLGADKTMASLLAGDCDIGFMGSESNIYVYQEGEKDYPVVFAQLTQRAGNFLVAREKMPDFSLDQLKGKTVIGGRAGGMPQMVWEYIVKQHGMDPKKDMTIIQNIDFGLTAEAFASGTGDYTIEFEPYANSLEKEGKGYVVASLGVESGTVPYTAYSVRKSFLEEHKDLLLGFTRGIQRGLDFVLTHTPKEIAKSIAPQFPETDIEDLEAIVERYQSQDTWKENTVFEESSFLLLENILEEGGVLQERVPYSTLVNTEISQEVE